MFKATSIAILTMGLALSADWQGKPASQEGCVQRCYTEPVDLELQKEEIVSLEKEAARAILHGSGTYFERVYSDDFAGTLSHGQLVNKRQWIQAVASPSVKRESFNASDIKVRIFEDTAIATCLWSSEFVVQNQRRSSQIRAIHVYLNTPSGWHVVSGQTTNLPPDVQQPL
jgi:hypothetical protein